MSKLFKLKEWLTLAEAVAHLTAVLGEPITEADLYRLCLDGHLTLSANFFNYASAKKGRFVKDSDIEYITYDGFLGDHKITLPSNHEIYVEPDKWICLEENVSSIGGVWDLPMLGAEVADIEHYYQQETSGVAVTLCNLDGMFVQRGDVICQLQTDYEENEFKGGSKAHRRELEIEIVQKKYSKKKEKEIIDKFLATRKEFLEERKNQPRENNYFPSGGLVEHDFALVVRTNEITRFLKSLEEPAQEQKSEKSLGLREKNTLLVLIGALCKQANIDPKMRGVSTSIEVMTQELGAPISNDTIRNVLKQIEDAVESKSK